MENSVKPETGPQELLEIQLAIAQAIANVPDPLAILDEMLDNLQAIRNVDAVGVYFRSEIDGQFILREHSGLNSNEAISLVVVENNDWDGLQERLKVQGFEHVTLLPINTNKEISGYLVAATLSHGGISPSVRTVLETTSANLSGMLVHSKTEAALRSSRHNLATVFEKFGDFLFMVKYSGEIITCNKCFLENMGFLEDDVVSQSINRVLPGILAMMSEINDEASQGKNRKQSKIYQGKMLDKNSRLLPVEIRISLGYWDDEEVWYVTCRDVKDRLRMERERNRLAKAIEQTTESIVITNADGLIIYTNTAFCELTGYTKEEVLDENPRILKSGNQDERFYRSMWETISKGDTWSGRLENCKKDGTTFIEEASISPMRDEHGVITHFIGVKRDVSSEVELENKLRESQKMEAIGTLAGGIAHDFNNILYALLGYGELALDDIPEDHPARIPVQEICKAGERATDLVDKMLTFGRRADSGREVISLKPVIEEALGLARASLPATIAFNINLQEHCPPVSANQTQIHQVVLNLCTNAEYALRKNGGTLEVSLKECRTGLKEAKDFSNLPHGSWLRLDVSDTGIGMDQTVINRIFEPYFTTKKAHEGTGLGLATAHGIIKSHNGHIYAVSTLGEGSTFTIFLPVCEQEAHQSEVATQNTEASSPSHHEGRGNIMIIDDEQMIVDILCKALPRLGYEVAGFTEGVKALEVFRASPDSFDLVITDQTMPQITGFEVAAELLSIRPDLPIVLTTGYASKAGEENARAIGISRFVSKPMKVSELYEIVNELLGEVAQV